MLKSVKRYILIGTICVTLTGCGSGCVKVYHNDGNNEAWIKQQVENGNMTEEEAKYYLSLDK